MKTCVTHHACDCIQAELKLLRELEAACRDTECAVPYVARSMALGQLDEFRAALAPEKGGEK